jgi:hypothetical protein
VSPLLSQMRILVAIESADLRKGIDGLAQLCREKLGAYPRNSHHADLWQRRITEVSGQSPTRSLTAHLGKRNSKMPADLPGRRRGLLGPGQEAETRLNHASPFRAVAMIPPGQRSALPPTPSSGVIPNPVCLFTPCCTPSTVSHFDLPSWRMY